MRIKRKRLIKLAFATLDKFPAASESDRNHMLYAACTMPRVAVGEWTVDGNCGCLVGTMLLNEGYTADEITWPQYMTPKGEHRYGGGDRAFDTPRATVLQNIGLKFDLQLRDFLAKKYNYQTVDDVPGQAVEVV